MLIIDDLSLKRDLRNVIERPPSCSYSRELHMYILSVFKELQASGLRAQEYYKDSTFSCAVMALYAYEELHY